MQVVANQRLKHERVKESVFFYQALLRHRKTVVFSGIQVLLEQRAERVK